jgi:hypothetical protein
MSVVERGRVVTVKHEIEFLDFEVHFFPKSLIGEQIGRVEDGLSQYEAQTLFGSLSLPAC